MITKIEMFCHMYSRKHNLEIQINKSNGCVNVHINERFFRVRASKILQKLKLRDGKLVRA